jgi:hypothetical protein
MMNKYAVADDVKAIAKQWNMDDFEFYMSLEVSTFSLESTWYSHLLFTFQDWFFGKRIADQLLYERCHYGRLAGA